MTWHSEARRYQIRGSWSVNESKRVSSRPTPGNQTIEFPSWSREFPVPRVCDDPRGGESFRRKGAIDPTSPRTFGFVLSNPGIMKKVGCKNVTRVKLSSQDETESFRKWDLLFLFYFAITIKYIQIYNFWFCIITSYHGKEISLFLLLDRIKKFTRIIKFNPNAFRVNKFYNIVDSEMFQKILECLSCKISKRDQIRNNSKII